VLPLAPAASPVDLAAAGLAVVLTDGGCLASGVAPGVDLVVSAASALSKYLSNAALALPGGPKGVFFSPPLSLLTDLARWIILLAVDIFDVVDNFDELDNLLWLDTLLISDPEPNSCYSLVLSCDMLRPIFFSLPSRPLDFFFSPGNNSL